jgi:hypothetical protein
MILVGWLYYVYVLSLLVRLVLCVFVCAHTWLYHTMLALDLSYKVWLCWVKEGTQTLHRPEH